MSVSSPEMSYGTLTPSAIDAPNIEEYAELFSLHTARCADFELCKVVAHGSQGTVFCVRCRMANLPASCADKLYALKVFYHFHLSPSDDHFESFRRARENEWQVLAKALRHRNIIRIWTCFEDTISDQLWEELPDKARRAILCSSGEENGRRLAQFVVFDHYEQSLREALQTLPQPLPADLAKHWSLQLLEVARYLKSKNIVHCDMKLDHLLLSSNQDLVVTGFSCAKILREHFFFPFSRDASPGGSDANIAPEVLNEFSKLRRRPAEEHHAVDFGHQTAWAIGVNIYEAITGRRPLVNYPAAFQNEEKQIAYSVDDIEHLPASYGKDFDGIVRSLLEPDPMKRLDEDEAMQKLHAIHQASVHAQLSEVERQLAEEREKRRKAENDLKVVVGQKETLVRERIRIVDERKTQGERIRDLESEIRELRADREAASDRHAETAYRSLKMEHAAAMEELDKAIAERDRFMLELQELKKRMTDISQQRDTAMVDNQRLCNQVEGK